jgi:hypothetical protein
MVLHGALAYSALAASILLLVTATGRALPAVAVLASGLEVLRHLGLLRLQVAGLPLDLLLGLALAIPGLVAWFRSTTKAAISAATIVAFVGALQVLAYALPRLAP